MTDATDATPGGTAACPGECLVGTCLSRYPGIDCAPPAVCLGRATLKAVVGAADGEARFDALRPTGSGVRVVDALSRRGLVIWERTGLRLRVTATDKGRAAL